MDRFNELPDELILMIFTSILDPKTLIRCCLVCKRFGSLIPKTSRLSIIIPAPIEAGSLPCSQSHDHHIPIGFIPALMKVFADLISIKIKFCNSLIKSDDDGHLCFWKAIIGSDFELCLSLGVETLFDMSRKLGKYAYVSAIVTCFYFLQGIFPHCPKTLKSVVISSAIADGFRGKVFMGEEQLVKLTNSISNAITPSIMDGLHGYRMREEVWNVRQGVTISISRQADQPIVMERDVKELLGAFDDEEEEGIGEDVNYIVTKFMKNNPKIIYSS